jgi:autoinducer 2-degrading protein
MRYICSILLCLILALALVAPAPAQENPIEKAVKAALKDPSKPFTMMVHVKVKDGAGAKFEAAFAKAIIGTRKEKGNKAYDLNRSIKSPNEYIVYERWQDFAALQAHLKTPHIITLLSDISDLLDGPPEAKAFVPAGE